MIFIDGGFFVFGDLSVRIEGQYRLRFTLFEITTYVKKKENSYLNWLLNIKVINSAVIVKDGAQI